MSGPILAIENLTIDLPAGSDRRHAVEDVSLALAPREILCVVGESGSGKSLTAQAALGLLPGPHVRASSGVIRFAGQDLLRLAEPAMRKVRSAGIGMIFQEPMSALNPIMRVGDQIAEVLRFHGQTERVEDRVRDALASVGLPDPATLRDAFPFRLSGGQRQRVMIAMALVLDPSVLIADEPTTALDVTTQAHILALIKAARVARGMAVLFITHDLGVVAEIGDRIAVMCAGRLVETGRADDVLERPQHEYTQRLLAAVPRLEPRRPPSERIGPPRMTVKDLSKTFRTAQGWLRPQCVATALNNVSFTVDRGETLGVVGESGSGKSTLARCILRLIEPDGGSVTLGGNSGNFLELPAAALRHQRRKIQMIFQDPYGSLNPRHRVGDIIAAGPLAHGEDLKTAQARVRDLLELVGLDPSSITRYPHEFSGGQRQRIGIARALALEPDILVADEPVSALDVSVQARVLELLDSIQRRLALSMIFITHDLRIAAQICDTVAVMHRGVIVEHGSAGQVLGDPQHVYTQQLIASIPGRSRRKGTAA